jgi:hypothetical protein
MAMTRTHIVIRAALAFVTLVASGGCATSSSGLAASPVLMPEVRVHVAAPAAAVMPRVVAAFMDHALPVSSTEGSVIEAKLGREIGLIGEYEIVARALVLPSDSSGTDVRLYAEETAFNSYTPKGMTTRIGHSEQGRAKRTWEALLAIASQIQPDSTLRVVQ